MRRLGVPGALMILLGWFLLSGGVAGAYSLWQGEKVGDSSLFTDRGAVEFKKHDLITILIEEETEATNEATLESESKYNLKLQELDLLITLLTDKKWGTDDVVGTEGEYTAEKSLERDATAERKDEFKARVTAAVVEVLPNGNLILEARKKITINEEMQEITLTGTVRPEHVMPDYSVMSRYLANVDMTLKGEGPVTRGGSRRGWLARIIDIIWPF
jgi:flagellar L-ring protein precursor FlgH